MCRGEEGARLPVRGVRTPRRAETCRQSSRRVGVIGDTDRELMLRMQNGDEAAFGALIDRYRARAVNIAYRYLGDDILAEDVAQEAFVRLYETRNRFDASLAFSPWFYRILSNLCLDHLRANRRRDARLTLVSDDADAPEQQTDGTSTPQEQLEREELSRHVQAALLRLPDRQRMALILQHYEGLDYDQIGQVMQCSRGTVDGLLSRARATLRERLEGSLGK